MSTAETSRAAAFASQADRSRELAAGHLRQVLSVVSQFRGLRDNVSLLLASFQVEHRWVGTRLDIKAPDGQWAAGPDLRGVQGRALELRSSEGYIQWRVSGSDGEWTNLLSISALASPIEFQTSATHLQYRMVGAPDWEDLVAKSELGISNYNELSGLPMLGNAASRNVGSGAGEVAAGDHGHDHFSNADNPHGVTKAQVGLSAVDNVSAASLRDRDTHTGVQAIDTVSGLQIALDGKVPITRTFTAGSGVTGGGAMDADRTFAVDKATAANFRARASNKVLTADGLPGAKEAVSLAYSATRSLVWTDGWYRTCTMTGNMLLSNPSSVEAGDTILIRLAGNNATERSITFGTNYKGNLPDETVTSTRAILLSLTALSSTEIVVSYVVLE